MGKVLRVLVVLMFLLGIGALVLSILNFNKRELLIGRTNQLEEGYIRLAKTIEAQDMPEVPPPALTPRDTSPVTSREIDNPETSDFWDDYRYQLEPPSTAIPMIDLGTDDKRLQLRRLYKLDANGKPEIDELTGRPAVKGPGTMADLMDSTLKRAMAQSTLLGTTRAELRKVREELVATIEELNSSKKDGRKDKKAIETLNGTISTLESDKSKLNGQISKLNDQINELNEEVAEAKLEVESQQETIDDLNRQVKKLQDDLDKFKSRTGGNIAVGPAPAIQADALEGKITPGECGKIVTANNEYRFVVIHLTDAFLDELIGSGRDQPMPPAELMVRRPGFNDATGDLVTKVRLRQLFREKNLAVAEILVNWMQADVKADDAVFF